MQIAVGGDRAIGGLQLCRMGEVLPYTGRVVIQDPRSPVNTLSTGTCSPDSSRNIGVHRSSRVRSGLSDYEHLLSIHRRPPAALTALFESIGPGIRIAQSLPPSPGVIRDRLPQDELLTVQRSVAQR